MLRFAKYSKFHEFTGQTNVSLSYGVKEREFGRMIFVASRCADQYCDARYQIAIAAIAMRVAARYPPFGEKRVGMCIYVCAGGVVCARGSSGLSHDDSLITRLYNLIHRFCGFLSV